MASNSQTYQFSGAVGKVPSSAYCFNISCTQSSTNNTIGTISFLFSSSGSYDWYANAESTAGATITVYTNGIAVGTKTVNSYDLGSYGSGLNGVLNSNTITIPDIPISSDTYIVIDAHCNSTISLSSGTTFVVGSVNTTWSNPTSGFKFAADPAPAPTGLTLSLSNKLNINGTVYDNISNSSNVITVTASANGATGYQFWVTRAEAGYTSAITTGTSNTYTKNECAAYTSYIFHAKAYANNADGVSTFTDEVNITIRTKKAKPSISIDGLHDYKSGDPNVSYYEDRFTINYSVSNADNVYYRYMKSTASDWSDWKVYGGSSPMTLTGFSSATFYYFQLRATNTDGDVTDSNYPAYRTRYSVPTVSATYSDSGLNSITFICKPSRSGNLYYKISTWSGYRVVASEPINGTTLTFEDLSPNTWYDFSFYTVSDNTTDGLQSSTVTSKHSTDNITILNTLSANGFADGAVTINATNYSGNTTTYSVYVGTTNIVSGNSMTFSSTTEANDNKWTPTQAQIDAMYKKFPKDSNAITIKVIVSTKGKVSGETKYYTSEKELKLSINKNSKMFTTYIGKDNKPKRCQVWIGGSDNKPKRAITFIGKNNKPKRTI